MMDKGFTVLTECELAKVDGGKGSKGSSYVAGFASAAIAGTGLGGAICGVPCAMIGAHYAPIGWTIVTGATGGF